MKEVERGGVNEGGLQGHWTCKTGVISAKREKGRGVALTKSYNL